VTIKVEVATTPEKLARGLMYRDKLPEDAGMLFVFDRAQPLSFWGRNTFIPLDIAFIDKAGKVAEISRIKRLSEVPVRCTKPCLMALEVNEGHLAKHGVGVGDLVVLDQQEGNWVVSFQKDGEEVQKTAQARRGPKVHPTLPFDQVAPQDPMPDWMQDVRSFMPSQRPQPQPTGHGFGGDEQPDPATLPEMDISDIMTADDEDEGESLDGKPKDPAEMSPDAYDEMQGEEALDQAPPPPAEGLPDPRRMNTTDALKYAEDNGLVMWINYRCKNAKRKIGMSPPRVIHRIIQPHGVYHARTTGNTLEVTWDMSVNDFRAYIVPNITAKGFTGQTFKKFFRVKGDDSIKPDGDVPQETQQGIGPPDAQLTGEQGEVANGLR
jgi:uncharacterized membrane protein (UPF0127 family)